MSLGAQKKFLLRAAWIGDPLVLLLDEPSNGLDSHARALLAQLIQRKSVRSRILFTSHDSDFVIATQATVISMHDLLQPSLPGL